MGCDLMGFKVKYNEESPQDGLEVMLKDIQVSAEVTEREMLKLAGNRAKEEVEKQLNHIKRADANRYGRPALADDVKLSIRKNNWGELTAQIKGGKKTGTLWHLVNEGNLYSRPTFFLDAAIRNLDNAIDGIWEKIDRKMT